MSIRLFVEAHVHIPHEDKWRLIRREIGLVPGDGDTNSRRIILAAQECIEECEWIRSHLEDHR